MLRNPYNPLYSPAAVEPPANSGGAPATQPETQQDEQSTDEQTEDPENPDPEPEPEAPAASAKPQLSAFERGKLRLLGSGDLINRLEASESGRLSAEAEVTKLQGQVAKLTAENTRLTAENAKLPEQIAAAEKSAETKLAKGVGAELTKLGVEQEQAPSQLTAEQSEKTMTRADFEKLDHTARNQFMREGGKLTA